LLVSSAMDGTLAAVTGAKSAAATTNAILSALWRCWRCGE